MKKTVDRIPAFALLLMVLLGFFPLRGMSEDTEPVFDRAHWESASAEHDYSDEKPPEPKEDDEDDDPPLEFEESSGPTWFQRNKDLLSTLVMSIVVLVLLTLVTYLVIRHMNERDLAVERTDLSDYTLEQLDATVKETELERFLREALERKEYRAAVRIYYLLTLNRLNERGFIRWERDKTNRSYLNEIDDIALREPFAALTLTYEVMWYGEAPIDEATFDGIRPDFTRFIQNLNNG